MKRLCLRLGVSRSGYYDWIKRIPCAHAQQDASLLAHIQRVFQSSFGRYGSPKVYQALRSEGIIVSQGKIMKKAYMTTD